MIWIKKGKSKYLILMVIVVSFMSFLTMNLKTEAQNEQSYVEETLERLYHTGDLYRGYMQMEETEKLKFEGEITKEEDYLFMLLLKYDFIRGFRSSLNRIEQLDCYIRIVEKLHNNPLEVAADVSEKLETKAYDILTADILDSYNGDVTDYAGYHHYLTEIYEFNVEELLRHLKAVYEAKDEAYQEAVRTLKAYVTLEGQVKDQAIKIPEEGIQKSVQKDSQEVVQEKVREGAAESPGEPKAAQEPEVVIVPEKEQITNHQKDNIKRNIAAISEEETIKFRIPNTQLPLTNQAVLLSVKARPGYHTESCGQPCVTEVCAGATFTKNMGQWFEVCGVCHRGGYIDNRWFNVTIALDEYYACKHLGEIVTGYYRYGNCVKFGGTSKLDTRINIFRHQVAFCPEHEKPNTYTVAYESDGGSGYMGNSSFTYDQTGTLERNRFSKDGRRFLGWSTTAGDTQPLYSDGSTVKNLTNADRGMVTMYAVWQEVINIRYSGNGATGGNERSEEVVVKAGTGEYQIQSNQAFTSYTKEGYTFAGWATQDIIPSHDTDYFHLKNLPENIALDKLRAIAKYQKKTENHTNALTVTFYAVWDELPILKAADVLEFFEGEVVTKDMLLSNISVKDREAEALKEPLDIHIMKLEYASGKLVDGVHQEGEVLLWSEGMPDEYTLDTWFLQLDKKDSPVTHKVFYQVTDGFGNSAALEWAIKVKYNEFPEIKSKDRYFTLAEAQNGKVTVNELLSQLEAVDAEDGDISSSLKIVGFAEEEFLSFRESGYVVLNAVVQDKYGKETVRQFAVHIIKDGEIKEQPEAKYLRFIDKKNYEKNAAMKSDDLTDQEVNESSANGGMKSTSVWYSDEEHRNLIKATLDDKKLEETWIFSADDISEIKKYVTANGIENSQKEESLSQFIAAFGDLRH